MSDAEVPSLSRIVLGLARAQKSDIPSEMLERVVGEFVATQFDDDRSRSLQYLREIADEYALTRLGGNGTGS